MIIDGTVENEHKTNAYSLAEFSDVLLGADVFLEVGVGPAAPIVVLREWELGVLLQQ